MKCLHCGKKYDDSFTYCPYCAEPKPDEVQRVSINEAVDNKNKTIWARGFGVFVITTVIMIPINYVIAFLIECFLYLFTPSEGPTVVDAAGSWVRYEEIHEKVWSDNNEWILLLSAVGIGLLVGLFYVINWKFKSNRMKMISIQFESDQKSICPVCGSHSIALGRKGYDWNKGFWYRMFNIKGGHYLAGMDSRRVTAHCQNCGHSWLTNEEWLR